MTLRNPIPPLPLRNPPPAPPPPLPLPLTRRVRQRALPARMKVGIYICVDCWSRCVFCLCSLSVILKFDLAHFTCSVPPDHNLRMPTIMLTTWPLLNSGRSFGAHTEKKRRRRKVSQWHMPLCFSAVKPFVHWSIWIQDRYISHELWGIVEDWVT